LWFVAAVENQFILQMDCVHYLLWQINGHLIVTVDERENHILQSYLK